MREVRLVGKEGEQIGVVAIGKALMMAEDAGLDLVEVAPEAHPPVCKLMDYGKYKYEAAQKARDQRRNQAATQLKEIRLGLKIDQHDYEVKLGHIKRFLDGGDKVKIMIKFRGREQSRPEMGIKLMERLAEDIAEDGIVESSPRQDGRNMTMVIGPVKKKTDAVSAQRKRREDERQAKRDAKAERALRNQQRVAEQANAPVLKPLTFSQLGEGNLGAAAIAAENMSSASDTPPTLPTSSSPKPAATKTAGVKADATEKTAEKPAAEKPAPARTSARTTAKTPAKSTAGTKTTEGAETKATPKKTTTSRTTSKTTARKPAAKTAGAKTGTTARSTAKKTAPKSETSTAGKTEKPKAARSAKAETEEK